MFDRWFLAHPRSVGEGYFAHQRMALGFAGSLLTATLACFVHALVPCLFQTTASRTIAALNARMIVHRRAHPTPRASMDSSSSVL